MSLRDAFHKLAERVGLDDDEINDLLSEDANTISAEDFPTSIDFSRPIPGEAAERFELFLSDEVEPLAQKGSELLWYPMIREGQWAVRPGPAGQKKKSPLKVVAGHSKNQRKEIGLQDLIDAFNDGAVEYVTVPETHENKTLENTGFISGMKIAKAPIQTGPKKGQMAPTLFGGYHFTSSKAKEKVSEGSVAGRSCGILYDYVNTETGKKYPAVIEHVCLTNKPWITGMIPFGRKLSGVEGLSTEAMRLSDNEPSEEVLADPELLSEWAEREGLELAKGDIVWDGNKSFSKIQEKAREALDVLRKQHRAAMQTQAADAYTQFPDDFPYWHVRDCTESAVLIADGYSDGSDMYTAPYKWDANSEFELSAFTDWVKVKSVLVEDNAPDTADTADVESDQPTKVSEPDHSPRGLLALAQEERKQRRTKAEDNQSQETTHPRGGGKMDEKEKNKGLELSDDAKAHIQKLEDQLAQEKSSNTKLKTQLDRISGTVQEGTTDQWLAELRAMGLDEEHGFSAALAVLRDIAIADDGEPAVVSEKFSEDGNTEESLSVTDAFKRFFKAIKVGDDGKVALGQQLAEPSDKGGGDGGGEGERETNAGEGKPGSGDDKGDELSREEKLKKIGEENPGLGQLIGVGASGGGASKEAGTSNGGESK